MNISAIVVSSLLTVIGASAAAADLGTVKVCVEPSAAPPFVVTVAEMRAGYMFSDVGVKIDWIHGRRDCQAWPEKTIYIHIATDSPDNVLPSVLAYALPYDGAHIVVYYDRIARLTEKHRQPQLLAHVLAHEVTHILQGVSRHSAAGMMKANWNQSDYMEMYWKSLPFASEDVVLIQRGLDARTSRLAKR